MKRLARSGVVLLQASGLLGDPPNGGLMIVTVFRSRLRKDLSPEVLERLTHLGQRMYELAIAMPGFVSYKDFSSEDGESVTIVEFETMEDNLRWRNHHEHVAVQVFGRDKVFLEYNIQVCERVRGSRFP